MPIPLIQRLTGLSTVQKALLAGTAATAAAVIGTGAAYAATPSAPAAAPSTSQSQETTSGPDTDNIQSGDQTGPDTGSTGAAAIHTATKTAVHKVAAAVHTPTGGDTTDATGAADTDNVQSGDQTGPDTGGTDTAGSTTAADTDNVQSGDQTGPDTGGSAG